MLVFVSLINEKGINAHIVKVFHVVGLTVKHLLCLYGCVLLCNGFFLAVTLLTLACQRLC